MNRYYQTIPTRSWRHYPKRSYLQHASSVLIIRMSRAEKIIKQDIAKTQVRHWSLEEIRARWKDGRA